METPIKMDDLGGPPFKETPTCLEVFRLTSTKTGFSIVKNGVFLLQNNGSGHPLKGRAEMSSKNHNWAVFFSEPSMLHGLWM